MVLDVSSEACTPSVECGGYAVGLAGLEGLEMSGNGDAA